MTTITFDTLQFANQLKSAGFTEEQAVAIIDIQRKASTEAISQAIHDFHLDDIATKRDIRELELKIELVKAEMKRDIETVRKEISEAKADLTRWIIGAGFLQTTLIIGVLLKLAKLV